MKFEKHIDVENQGEKIAELLKGNTELSQQTIKRTMTKGAVWLTRGTSTNRVRRADKKLQIGDQLHLYYNEAVLSESPNEAILIADEKTYSLWRKPYGMLSQGSRWGDHCTIYRWSETHLKPERPAFIVHRLDRAASGLMLVAHSKKVAAVLSEQFQQRRIDKKYRAIVKGKIQQTAEFNSDIDGRNALTSVSALAYDEEKQHSLVEVTIETGRKHQIRKHLAEAGFPILGDRLYDKECQDNDPDLSLVSCYLGFRCPNTGAQQTFMLPSAFMPEL